MTGVAIVAALPREVAGLVKGWKKVDAGDGVTTYQSGRAVVVCAGMGTTRAALAAEAAMDAMPISMLISAGVAGACDAQLRVGDVVRASTVVGGVSGERFESGDAGVVLVSAASVADVEGKARLLKMYGADVVDMEASAVARAASARGIRFRAIKAISDESDFEMEGISRFATEDGRFRTLAFVLHTALRPKLWGDVLTLRRNSGIAVDALTKALRAELDLAWDGGKR
jgi:adenosylhomocysteine nucleosidase